MLHYTYFKEYYKVTAIDLSKQLALNADPKAGQQITFGGNLNLMSFIIEKAEETILDFSQRKVKLL